MKGLPWTGGENAPDGPHFKTGLSGMHPRATGNGVCAWGSRLQAVQLRNPSHRRAAQFADPIQNFITDLPVSFTLSENPHTGPVQEPAEIR